MVGNNITNILFLFVLALLLLYIIWFIYRQMEFLLWNVPRGPIGVPLLGYAPFLSADLYKDFAYLNKTYGKLCSFYLGTKRCVIVSDYDTTKELLSHPAVLSRIEHSFDFAPGKGGVSGMSGKEWALERKLSMQALRTAAFGNGLWEDVVLEEVQELLDTISIQKGEPMVLRRILYRLAIRSMLFLICGRQYVRKSDMELLYKGSEAFTYIIKCFGIFLFPSALKYLIKFNIGGFAKCQEILDHLEDKIREMVTETLKREDNNPLNYAQVYAKEVKKQKRSVTMDDASVDSLVGTSTTFLQANLPAILVLEWLLYFLASRPKLQARIQEEIDDAVGRNMIIRWEDRNKLPYTMACVHETERWASIIPIPGPRRASETFQFHEYTILKDTVILSSVWGSNRDTKYWKHPDEFMPERFMSNNIGNPITFGGYATFSFGKRNCPGEKISVMLVFLLFANIMQKYQLRTETGEPLDLEPREYNGVLEPKPQPLCFLERE